MGIRQDKGGLKTQRMDNKVRECVWDIAQSMSIINKQGAGPEQWDLLIDRCLNGITKLQSKRPLWERYMTDKTNLDGQKLKEAQDEFTEVGLCRRKNRLEETPTKKRKLVHLGIYFIAPMLLLLFLTMLRSRKQRGRNLGSQVFTDKGALQHLEQFRSRCQCVHARLRPRTDIDGNWVDMVANVDSSDSICKSER